MCALHNLKFCDGDLIFEPHGRVVLEMNGVVVSPMIATFEELGSPVGVSPAVVVVVRSRGFRGETLTSSIEGLDFSDTEPTSIGGPVSEHRLLEANGSGRERGESVSSGAA